MKEYLLNEEHKVEIFKVENDLYLVKFYELTNDKWNYLSSSYYSKDGAEYQFEIKIDF